MCGIVGYIGPRDAAPILMQGLHRLEYRGYDSAGHRRRALRGSCACYKCKGKVRELESRLPDKLRGGPGIAHTRWATHGEPSDRNAHPHCDAANRYAIVHNGIIENAVELRARLEAQGVVFQSQTDSEVLAHLVAAMPGDALEERVRAALRLVTGTYGLAVLDAEQPKTHRRRAQRQPRDSRPRRRRDVRRIRRGRAREPHAQHRALGRRRARRAARRRLRDLDARRRRHAEDAAHDRLGHRNTRQGRARALHAQGDGRAAGRDPPHARRPPRAALPDDAPRRRSRTRRASCSRFGA